LNPSPVDDFPEKLAKPVRQALHVAGITRLEQLTRNREAELLKMHGIGPKGIEQLRSALSARGLSFAKESGESGIMGKVIVGTTLSLDGFVNDRQGDVGQLYADFAAFTASERLQETIRATGAVVMGRRAFEMGAPDSYAGNYEFQVPIFVLTHHPPAKMPKQTEALTFTFVSDGIESAIAQAKAAAGAKDVQVIGGASTVQQCLNAGLADELHIDLMPLLLGDGLRFFENLDTDSIQLERMDLVALPGGRSALSFRIVR
jgi:dihydrofolate reductase